MSGRGGIRSHTPIAVSMVLGAIMSAQVGAALCTELFAEIGPGGVVLVRAVVSFGILWLVWRPGSMVPAREHVMVILAFGTALAGMNLSYYESIDRIPLGATVTVEFIGPLSVAILTSRRRLDWLWAALALAGLVLLASGLGTEGLELFGLGLAAIAGVFWGVYIMLGKRVGETAPGGAALILPMMVSAVIVAPVGISEGGSHLLDPRVVGIGIAAGALSSVLPFSLELEAMKMLRPGTFGILMSLAPAIAAATGFVVLGQGLGITEVAAIFLVVVASAGALHAMPGPRED